MKREFDVVVVGAAPAGVNHMHDDAQLHTGAAADAVSRDREQIRVRLDNGGGVRA